MWITNGSGMICADSPWTISLTVFSVTDKRYKTTLTLALRSGYDGGRKIVLLDYHRLWFRRGSATDQI